MKRGVGFKFLIVGAVAGVLFAMAASPAPATNSWGGYHWARTTSTFTLQLGSNVDTTWSGYLGVASSDWTSAAPLDTTVVPGQSNKRCSRGVSGRVEVCNGSFGNNGWLGLATIWISGGHITQGTVKVNDTYFSSSTYNNAYAKQHVICQEVGHTLGLDHQHLGDVGGGVTCMNDTAGLFDPAYIHPNSHDSDELATIYSHLDSTTTVARSSASSGASVDDPDDGGNGNGHAYGHESVIVHGNPNSDAVVQFVLWA